MRLTAHMQETLDQPAAFDDAALNRLLADANVASVSDLVTRFAGTVAPGTVTVTFAAPAPVAAATKPLPISAAILIRDEPLSLVDLLTESSLIRGRLQALGAERPANPQLRRTNAVIRDLGRPEVFSTTPTGRALTAARRANAGAWLAREGIGLAAIN